MMIARETYALIAVVAMMSAASKMCVLWCLVACLLLSFAKVTAIVCGADVPRR